MTSKPECGNCYGERHELCQILFTRAVSVQGGIADFIESSPLLNISPEGSLDSVKTQNDELNLMLFGSLGQIGCELTLEQVEQRIMFIRHVI